MCFTPFTVCAAALEPSFCSSSETLRFPAFSAEPLCIVVLTCTCTCMHCRNLISNIELQGFHCVLRLCGCMAAFFLPE